MPVREDIRSHSEHGTHNREGPGSVSFFPRERSALGLVLEQPTHIGAFQMEAFEGLREDAHAFYLCDFCADEA